MEIKIKSVSNGYIVETQVPYEEGELVEEVFTEDQVSELLYSVLESLGQTGSRYSEERIYIIKAPGDKSESFTEEHANVIWGKD